jgi:hypothetical protein
MKPINFNINNICKYLIFFLLLYISIIISLIYGEELTGEIFLDYINQKKPQDFVINFKYLWNI